MWQKNKKIQNQTDKSTPTSTTEKGDNNFLSLRFDAILPFLGHFILLYLTIPSKQSLNHCWSCYCLIQSRPPTYFVIVPFLVIGPFVITDRFLITNLCLVAVPFLVTDPFLKSS